jgi:hypothetical protein
MTRWGMYGVPVFYLITDLNRAAILTLQVGLSIDRNM